MEGNQHKRPFLLAGKKRRKIITIAGCLFLATVFWFFNALNNDFATIIKYPIKLDFDKKESTNFTLSDKYIKISAKGYGWYLLYYSLGIGVKPLPISKSAFQDNQYIVSESLALNAQSLLANVEVNYILSDTIRLFAKPIKPKRL